GALRARARDLLAGRPGGRVRRAGRVLHSQHVRQSVRPRRQHPGRGADWPGADRCQSPERGATEAGQPMTLHVDDPHVTADTRKVEAEEPKPPSLGKRFFNLRTLLSFALGFAILAFLFTRGQIDVGAILDLVRQANPWLLLLAVIAFYATFPVRAVRWRRLLDNVELSTHEEGGRR